MDEFLLSTEQIRNMQTELPRLQALSSPTDLESYAIQTIQTQLQQGTSVGGSALIHVDNERQLTYDACGADCSSGCIMCELEAGSWSF